MNSNLDNMVKFASKVRTPLAVSGITVVVLYAIYRQVLSLDVFSNVGSNSTFLLLQSVLDRVFWLALVSIFLGFISYLIPFVLGRQNSQLSSSLEIVDSNLDAEDSPYVQVESGKAKRIYPNHKLIIDGSSRYVSKHHVAAYQYDFPTIDFKFQNVGNATAFLHKFTIDIHSCEIDKTPKLSFEIYPRDYHLNIKVINNGWGYIQDLKINVEETVLNCIASLGDLNLLINKLDSGDEKHILLLSVNQNQGIHESEIKNISRESKIPVEYLKYRDPFYESSDFLSSYGIKIGDIKIAWNGRDEEGKVHKHEYVCLWEQENEDSIALISQGFVAVPPEFCVAYATIPSEITYVSMIDPSKQKKELSYNISRKVSPGDVERFHILLGARKSCRLFLNLKFHVYGQQIIESDKLYVYILCPRDSFICDLYTDGEEIKRAFREKIKKIEEVKKNVRRGLKEDRQWSKEREKKLKKLLDEIIDFQRKRESSYPFIPPLSSEEKRESEEWAERFRDIMRD